MTTDSASVGLDAAAYDLLEAEARRRRLAPDALAAELVRDGLARTPGMGRIAVALSALDAVSQEMPEADAVRVIREGREERMRQIDEWLDTLTPAAAVPGRSVELDPAAYELLQVEARRRHIELEGLAAELVRGALGPSAADGGEREKQRRQGLDADGPARETQFRPPRSGCR